MIYLAFPGLGKTPLSLRRPGYMDLDFGHFREAFGLSKEKEAQLVPQYAKLLEHYSHDGFTVLANDPKILSHVKVDRMFLPRSLRHSAKKLNVSEETADVWVHDWKRKADDHHVPVIWLDVGLDHYLSGKSNGGVKNGNQDG